MADFDPDAYLSAEKPFDPDSYLGKEAAAPSTLDRVNSAISITPPEQQRGIMRRAKEGADAPMLESELGISEENRKKYPWLNYLQGAARTLDVAKRTPASVWGGIAGAGAGVAEKFMSPAWADRLQRDLGALPASIAPEVPVAAPELSALRRGHEPAPPVRPPPLPEMPPALPPEVSAIPRQVDRPGADVGLLRTDVPHELPAAQSRALSAAGNGGPLSELSPDTVAFLRQRLENEGLTKNTLDDRLANMSAHQFFGEIGPSLENDMSGIARHSGPGRVEIMGSTRQRALEGPERAGHSLTRAFGESENIPQMQRIMDIEKKREADPLYTKFRETEITPTPAIDALLPRLEAAGVLQGANRALRVEGQPTHHGFTTPGEVTDLRTSKNVPTAGAFQLALEDISDKVGKAMRDGEKGEVRRLTQLRNDLIDALDNHPNVGDTWRQARMTTARPAAIKDAIEMGRNALTNKISADELPFLTSHYSEPEMRALRVGIHDSLRRMLGKRDTMTAELHNTVLSPNNVQKLRWAIGDAAADALVAEFEHERYMHTAPTRIHGNSVTASATQAMKDWGAPDAGASLTLGDIAGAVRHPGKAAASAAIGAADKFGVSSRRKAAEAKWARMREEAARIMTLQGPERDAVARYLIEPPPAPYARGGRVPVAKPKSVRQNGFVYTLQADGSYR